jgi:hypothetical protein
MAALSALEPLATAELAAGVATLPTLQLQDLRQLAPFLML